VSFRPQTSQASAIVYVPNLQRRLLFRGIGSSAAPAAPAAAAEAAAAEEEELVVVGEDVVVSMTMTIVMVNRQ
jgi:hypothetical protein